MKIIKQGDLTPKPPWWVGRKLTCSKCGCEFVLEEGDDVYLDPLEIHGGTNYALCPFDECVTRVPFSDARIRRPKAKPDWTCRPEPYMLPVLPPIYPRHTDNKTRYMNPDGQTWNDGPG